MATATKSRSRAKSTATPEYSDGVVEAAAMYLRRQARKEHPAGRFDRGGRFYLAEACGRECSIRPPSRAYPYSQMVHGRSLVHCAHALGESSHAARSLLAAIRRRSPAPVTAESIALTSVDDDLAQRIAGMMARRAQDPDA